MSRPEAPLEHFNPATGIDKAGIVQNTGARLRELQTQMADRLSQLLQGATLKDALSYRTSEEQQAVDNNHLPRIMQLTDNNLEFWVNTFYKDQATFDKKVKTKAEEYAQGGGQDHLGNYYAALGNGYDQAVAVVTHFQDLAQKVDGLKEITEQDKVNKRDELANKIRQHGDQIADAATRQQLVEQGLVSQAEINGILASNLVTDAKDNQSKYNKAGFDNDEAWNKAVHETAAGLLEDELIQKIKEIASVDENKSIYEKAGEVYQQRINQATQAAKTSIREGTAEPKEGEAEPKEGTAEPKEGEAEPKEGEAEPKEGEAEPKEGTAEAGVPQQGPKAAPTEKRPVNPQDGIEEAGRQIDQEQKEPAEDGTEKQPKDGQTGDDEREDQGKRAAVEPNQPDTRQKTPEPTVPKKKSFRRKLWDGATWIPKKAWGAAKAVGRWVKERSHWI